MKLREGLGLLVAAGLLSACATGAYSVYSRSFEQSPDVLWPALLERLKESDAVIAKSNPSEKTVLLRKRLTAVELYEYAEDPPPGLSDGGEAEIKLWLEPNPAGGSFLKAQSVLYSMIYEDNLTAAFPVNRPTSLLQKQDWRYEQQTENLMPVTLESNGLLEMFFLGYSEEEAARLLDTAKIQQEFQKVRKIQSRKATVQDPP